MAEDDLRLSEERYRILVEKAGEAIAVIQDGRIKFANLKLTELTELMVNDYGYAERIATVEIVDPDSKSNWTDRVKVKIGGKNAVAKRRINTDVEIIGKCGLFRAGTEDEPQYANLPEPLGIASGDIAIDADAGYQGTDER